MLGWFCLSCESARPGEAVCTDQWQTWSPPPPFENKWCGRELGQKSSLLSISLPWPVPSWDAPLPSALQGSVKVSPPAGQKNTGGEWGDTSSLELLDCHLSWPFPISWGEGETPFLWCWCEHLREALFPLQSWMSVSTFAALAITNKTCQKPEICI